MNADDAIEVSPASPDDGGARARRTGPSPRWAIVRLLVLWAPIAVVLSVVLWGVLAATLAPWGYRDNGPGELDALPSQLLFATLLLSVGRVETARHGKSEESISSMPTYWELTILLICLGVAALWYLAVTQPVAQ